MSNHPKKPNPTPWTKAAPRQPSINEMNQLISAINNGNTETISSDVSYCRDAYICVFDPFVPDDLSAYRGKLMLVIWPNRADNLELFGWDKDNKLQLLEDLQPQPQPASVG